MIVKPKALAKEIFEPLQKCNVIVEMDISMKRVVVSASWYIVISFLIVFQREFI